MPSTSEARAALAQLLATARPVPARVGARVAPLPAALPKAGLEVFAVPGGLLAKSVRRVA